MISRISIVSVLVILAVAVQGQRTISLTSILSPPNVVSLHKEGRVIAIPSLSASIAKGAKLAYNLVKSAWSIIGLKFGAIALVANLIIWGLKYSFSVILGAVGMFGFCKLSGKCSLQNLPKPVLEIRDTLLYAARQLQNGADLYENVMQS